MSGSKANPTRAANVNDSSLTFSKTGKEPHVQSSIQQLHSIIGNRALSETMIAPGMNGLPLLNVLGSTVHYNALTDYRLRAIGARAATVGSDVFLRSDIFNTPNTFQNRRTLAHEAIHVIQQSKAYGTPTKDSLLNRAPAEIEADKGASAILSGNAPDIYNFDSQPTLRMEEDAQPPYLDAPGFREQIAFSEFILNQPGIADQVMHLNFEYDLLMESIEPRINILSTGSTPEITEIISRERRHRRQARKISHDIDRNDHYTAGYLRQWVDAIVVALDDLYEILTLEEKDALSEYFEQGENKKLLSRWHYVNGLVATLLQTDYMRAGTQQIAQESIEHRVEVIEIFVKEHRKTAEFSESVFGILLAKLLTEPRNTYISELGQYGMGLNESEVNDVLQRLAQKDTELLDEALYGGHTIQWLMEFKSFTGFTQLRTEGEGLLSGISKGYLKVANSNSAVPVDDWTLKDILVFQLNYNIGVPVGVGLALKDLVMDIMNLFNPAFWAEIYKLATDEEHRYKLGLALGQSLAKEEQDFIEGQPAVVGRKIGKLVGRVFTEIVLMLVGIGAIAKAAKAGILARFPVLASTAKTIAESNVGRLAAASVDVILVVARHLRQRIQDLLNRLPAITAEGRMNRTLAELEAELLAASNRVDELENLALTRPNEVGDYLPMLSDKVDDLEIQLIDMESGELIGRQLPARLSSNPVRVGPRLHQLGTDPTTGISWVTDGVWDYGLNPHYLHLVFVRRQGIKPQARYINPDGTIGDPAPWPFHTRVSSNTSTYTTSGTSRSVPLIEDQTLIPPSRQLPDYSWWDDLNESLRPSAPPSGVGSSREWPNRIRPTVDTRSRNTSRRPTAKGRPAGDSPTVDTRSRNTSRRPTAKGRHAGDSPTVSTRLVTSDEQELVDMFTNMNSPQLPVLRDSPSVVQQHNTSGSTRVNDLPAHYKIDSTNIGEPTITESQVDPVLITGAVSHSIASEQLPPFPGHDPTVTQRDRAEGHSLPPRVLAELTDELTATDSTPIATSQGLSNQQITNSQQDVNQVVSGQSTEHNVPSVSLLSREQLQIMRSEIIIRARRYNLDSGTSMINWYDEIFSSRPGGTVNGSQRQQELSELYTRAMTELDRLAVDRLADERIELLDLARTAGLAGDDQFQWLFASRPRTLRSHDSILERERAHTAFRNRIRSHGGISNQTLRAQNEARVAYSHTLTNSVMQAAGLESEHLLPRSVINLDQEAHIHGLGSANSPTIMIDRDLHRAGITYGQGVNVLYRLQNPLEMVDFIIEHYLRLLGTADFSHLNRQLYADGFAELRQTYIDLFPTVFDANRTRWDE